MFSKNAAADAAPWRQRLAQTLQAPGPWLGALTFGVYSAQWLAVIGFLPSLYQQSGWGGARGAVLTALVAAVNMLGNIAAGDQNTYCPVCRTLAIRRFGYNTSVEAVTEDGACANCGEDLGIVVSVECGV